MSASHRRGVGRAGRAARVPVALLVAAPALSLAISGSSASVNPVPRSGKGAPASISPIAAGTKVRISAAKLDPRTNSRGGHALPVKFRGTRLFKGVGTRVPNPHNQDGVILAPPAAPTATAGTGMPIIGSGRLPLAAAPLTPGA